MPNTTITPTPITGVYNDLRFDVIEHAEGSRASVYIDTKGIATIDRVFIGAIDERCE